MPRPVRKSFKPLMTPAPRIEISLITPPVGLNVFVLKGVVGDVSTKTIFQGVTPFWIVDIIRLILLVAVPWLVLVLPNSMG